MLTGGDMAEICRTSLLQAMSTTRAWNDAIADEVIRKEDAVDHYEDVLGTYLVKLSAKHLSVEDNRSVNTLLHTIGDFERISDHAVNIIKTAQEIRDKDIKFSEEALNDLSVLEAAVQDIVNRTVDAFQKGDTYAAGKIEPLEQVVDGLVRPPHRASAGRCLHDRVRLCAGRSFDELRAHRRPLLEHCGGHDRGRGGQVRHPRISCQRQARRQCEV
jgi:phosphate:Na+ symporter